MAGVGGRSRSALTASASACPILTPPPGRRRGPSGSSESRFFMGLCFAHGWVTVPSVKSPGFRFCGFPVAGLAGPRPHLLSHLVFPLSSTT